MAATKRPTAVSEPTNGAQTIIEYGVPYIVTCTLTGVAPLLFHRWNNEAVEAKAKAAKGSKAKKTDDPESFVYRDSENRICMPGRYLASALKDTAKYRQDPRSPRKSAMDLFKAGIVPLTPLAPINDGATTWDYLDSQRVVVQRNAVTRVRPAFLPGWTATFDLMVNLPEYIPVDALHDTLTMAGRINGIADSRPTYGRFRVTHFEVIAATTDQAA